jgi:hypothetical protein
MATVLETLKQGVSNYPVPEAALQRIALVRGVDLQAEATAEILLSKEYRLAEADVKLWVSGAPNVSEAGISFDMLVSTRESLKKQADAVYGEYGDSLYEPENASKTVYGYKGKKL